MNREELDRLLSQSKETEHLEFKAASNQMSILGDSDGKKEKKSIFGYCVAIGNEGGGRLILGVENKIDPSTGMRKITGTNAIPDPQKVKEEIYKALGSRIDIQSFETDAGKVQVITIPSRPYRGAFKFYGVYLMRNGEQLVEMDQTTLASHLNEGREDFSALVETRARWSDLDPTAINLLKAKLIEKTKNKDLIAYTDKQILSKLLLVDGDKITNACLLLVGKADSIGRLIPNAEVFLEWRVDPRKTDSDLREVLRESYLTAQEKVWNFVNSRNVREPFKQGFFEFDIWAYDEDTVREAVLNAFAHREYIGRTEPVYVKISPESLTVKSAGGLLPGVTLENIFDVEGKWRNRLLMEALSQIGLVERKGLGMDRIFRETIRQGKGFPDFKGTTHEDVVLNIPAKIKDLNFVRYLQKTENENPSLVITLKDLILLEEIRASGKTQDMERLAEFLKNGIVEKLGRGRGTKYVLGKGFYEFIDNRGEYTRKKWLTKEQQKQVLRNYLSDHGKGRMVDFKKLFEGRLSPNQIFVLLNELRSDNLIFFDGKPRSRNEYWKLKSK